MSFVLGLDPAIATMGFALLERSAGGVALLDLGVWETPSTAGIPARLGELRGDVAAYLRDAADKGWPIDTLVVETPSFLRDASASSKLWVSYGLLLGLAQGRLFVDRATDRWRAALGLPPEKAAKVAKPTWNHTRGDSPTTPCEECLRLRRAKYTAGREAKGRRKASTANLMRARYGEALAARLDRTPDGLHEHAIDALAIATSWTDDCDRAKAQPGAQPMEA